MKDEYLYGEFSKTCNNLENLCVEAINLLRMVLDYESTHYLYTWLNDIFISPEKTKLRKSVTEIEKELYRVKIILRGLIEKRETGIKGFEEKINSREEGILIQNLSGWRQRKLLKVQEEIMDIYRLVKKFKA